MFEFFQPGAFAWIKRLAAAPNVIDFAASTRAAAFAARLASMGSPPFSRTRAHRGFDPSVRKANVARRTKPMPLLRPSLLKRKSQLLLPAFAT